MSCQCCLHYNFCSQWILCGMWYDCDGICRWLVLCCQSIRQRFFFFCRQFPWTSARIGHCNSLCSPVMCVDHFNLCLLFGSIPSHYYYSTYYCSTCDHTYCDCGAGISRSRGRGTASGSSSEIIKRSVGRIGCRTIGTGERDDVPCDCSC